MELLKAKEIATELIHKLEPFSDRAEYTGYLRREQSDIRNIELIVIPKRIEEQGSLFGKEMVVSPDFVNFVNTFERVSGEANGKCTTRRLSDGVNLVLYMCTHENWGYKLLVSTGSFIFTRWVMVELIKRRYTMNDGYVYKGGARIPIYDEEKVFNMINRNYIDPINRNYEFLDRKGLIVKSKKQLEKEKQMQEEKENLKIKQS